MGRPAINITGHRFGNVVVVERDGYADRNAKWKCRCDCGKEFVAVGTKLRCGRTTSCGCTYAANIAERQTTHGMSHTRLYQTWFDMVRRCHNPKSKSFPYYGAHGLTVCDEWKESFEAFAEWSSTYGYTDELFIDRVENDKGYSPDNCRWVTRVQNNNNKTNNVLIEYEGNTYTMSQLAKHIGVKYKTLHNRYRKGWRGEKLIKGVVPCRV